MVGVEITQGLMAGNILDQNRFGFLAHPMRVLVRSKWWPLPSHAPIHKSKFFFPKVATVKMLYSTIERQPTSDMVWLKPWDVPLSERIANRSEWHSIIEKLG